MDMVPFKKRHSLGKLFSDMSDVDLLRDFFNEETSMTPWANIKTDIKDEGTNYLVEAELPGFKKDDIKLEVVDNRLTISAKREKKIDEKKDSYIRKERHYGEVCRTFLLDESVKADKIDAKFDNGMLTITLPKIESSISKTTKIDIK